MKLPPFKYHRPDSLSEAVALLASYEADAKVLAGGQSLIPMMAYRLVQPRALIDIGAIPGLDLIESSASGLWLGGRARWVDIQRSRALAAANPLLARAVAHIAHEQIRNRGTAGGSLAHADPAAELPAVCVACDAMIEVAGPRADRSMGAGDFFHGMLTTDLAHDEVIRAIRFAPWPAGRRWGFGECSRRPGDFAIAGLAVLYELNDDRVADPRIVTFGVSDAPERLAEVEAYLDGRALNADTIHRAGRIASEAVRPISDPQAPADYRRALVGVLLRRAIEEAANRGAAGTDA